jgi:FkbM family methyltransferase
VGVPLADLIADLRHSLSVACGKAHGLTAVAIEPQLLCLNFIAAAAKRNNLSVELHHNVLSPRSFSVSVRTDACEGTTQYLPDGQIRDAFDNHFSRVKHVRPAGHARVESVSLDSLLQSRQDLHIALWHIDTEGAEIEVLRSAGRLFGEGRISRILLEWAPPRWKRFNVTFAQGLGVARHFLSQGWRCRDMCGHSINWVTKLPDRKRCRNLPELYCERESVTVA